jgi:hypothetical protein
VDLSFSHSFSLRLNWVCFFLAASSWRRDAACERLITPHWSSLLVSGTNEVIRGNVPLSRPFRQQQCLELSLLVAR